MSHSTDELAPAIGLVTPQHNSEDSSTPLQHPSHEMTGAGASTLSDSAGEAHDPVEFSRIESLNLEDERLRIQQVLQEHPSAMHSLKDERDPAAEILSDLPSVASLNLNAAQPYFFGWPMTAAWLAVFWKHIAPKDRKFPLPEDGFRTLARLSGYADLQWTRVVHPEAPVYGDIVPAGVKISWFVGTAEVRTVDGKSYFIKRPTEAQYAWLRRVLPGEPGWYRSTTTLKDWLEIEDELW